MLRVFPLLALAVAAYNYYAFLDPTFLNVHPFKMVLPSGMPLAFTGAQLLVAGGLGLLFLEMLKASGGGCSGAADHALSVLLFGACVVELVVEPRLGTPEFTLLALMALIDVAAGVAISLATARRDVTIG
ncbi:MAG: hypothetical protein AB7D51_11470 [Desulfovibrionaceae bacterium]